jgi:hypothetical protein
MASIILRERARDRKVLNDFTIIFLLVEIALHPTNCPGDAASIIAYHLQIARDFSCIFVSYIKIKCLFKI